jgi:hypothetical protein
MRKKFELADLPSIGRRLLVSAFVAAVAGTAYATEYHVSVSGSDSNSGTSTAPFKTIGKAASVMKAGDICTIHAGTYRETVTPGSGTSSAHLLFRAGAGESVVIDGCDAVTASSLGRLVSQMLAPIPRGRLSTRFRAAAEAVRPR